MAGIVNSAAPKLSFDDWKNQLAIDSITGGVLGTPTSGDGAISADVAGSDLYAKARQDLLDKMGGDGYLQGLYDKGVTPQQVLYGQAGQPTDQPMQAPPTGAALYNPGLYKDPNATAYDPRYGIVNTSGPKGSLIDTVGDMIPSAIMAGAGMVTMNPGILGSAFAGGGLSGLAGSAFSIGGNTIFNGNLDPISAASSLASGLGLPGWATTLGGMAAHAALDKSPATNATTGSEPHTPAPAEQPATPQPSDIPSMMAGTGAPSVLHGENSALSGNSSALPPSGGISALPGAGGVSALPGPGIANSALPTRT